MTMPLALVWDLIAVDKASPVFGRVSASANAAATGVDRAMARYTRAMRRADRTGVFLTHRLTLPLAAIGAVSAKMATDFNASMTRIRTQAGGTAKDVRVLSKEVLALAKYAQQGPDELAKSLYHLKSVGLANRPAMKALRQSADFAAVGQANLEETTNALAGAWRTGIRGAKNFHQAVSTLNAVIGAGNMTMEDLNLALGTGILPSAKTFGLTLKDVGAALAVFTDEGVPADAAATRLRMTFSLLAAPTEKARKQLHSIGLTQYQLANDMRKRNGLVVAVGDLKKHLDDSGLSATRQAALLSRAFGGGRSSSAILSLVNNFDVLRQKQEQVTRSMGNFDKAVRAQRATPEAQFKLLESSLQRSAILLGNQLLPLVIKAADKIAELAERFNSLSDGTKKTVVQIGIGVALLGPMLSILGKIGLAFGFLASTAIGMTRFVAGLTLMNVGLATTEKQAWKTGFALRASMTQGASAAGALKGALLGVAAGATIGYFTRNMSTAGKAVGDLAAAASGAALGLAVGGPLGAAVGGIGGLLGALGGQFTGMSKSAQEAARLATEGLETQKSAADSLFRSLQNVRGAYDAQFKDQVFEQLRSKGLVEPLTKGGLDPQALIKITTGVGKVSERSLRQYAKAISQLTHEQLVDLDAIDKGAGDAERQWELYRRSQGKLILTQKQLAGGLGNLRHELANVGQAQFAGLAHFGHFSAAAYRNTEVVRENVIQLGRLAVQEVRHGGSAKAALAKYQQGLADVQNTLLQLGGKTPEVLALMDKLGKLPTIKRLLLRLDAQATENKITDIQKRIDNIRQGKVPTIDANTREGRRKIIELENLINSLNGKTVYITAQYKRTYAAGSDLTPGYALPGGATGFTNVPQGFSTINESGWELLHRTGSQVSVIPHKTAMAMTGLPDRLPGFADGTKGYTVTGPAGTQTYSSRLSGMDALTALVRTLNKAMRSLANREIPAWGRALKRSGADVRSAFGEIRGTLRELGASKTALHRLTLLDNKLAKEVDLRNRDMDKLQGLRQARTQLSANVRQTVAGSFDIATAGTGPSGSGKPTFGSIFAQALQQKNIVHKWAAALKKLGRVFGKSAVGRAMLQRLFEDGPDSFPQVQALAAASKSQLRNLIATETQITRTGRQAGAYIGGVEYNQRIRQAQATVRADAREVAHLYRRIDHLLEVYTHRPIHVTLTVNKRVLAIGVAEGTKLNARHA